MVPKRIVVLGFMAQCPLAGVIWQHLHYVAGLQRLGYEVYYIEDSARLPCNPVTFEEEYDHRNAAELLERLSRDFGFENRWAFCPRYQKDFTPSGLSFRKIAELYREADAVLNVCGSHELNEELEKSRRLIYVESDPGVEQILVDNGSETTLTFLNGHDRRFTFGENVGTEAFPVPLHGLEWLPTRQPVVTEFWKTETSPLPGAVLTTIANWNTSGQKDVSWRGERYLWSKSMEFLRHMEAPDFGRETFELSTGIKDTHTAAEFERHGWRLSKAGPLSVDRNRYRKYIQDSKGEFTVAKDQYVRLHTGWFSDRSACYLAAGRPVITQETGFSRHIETGRGLFAFESLEDIGDAVRAINSDYERHSRSAREIALEYFEAAKVLASLLERAGV